MVPSTWSCATSCRARRTASSTGSCCARSWQRDAQPTIAGVRHRRRPTAQSAASRSTGSPSGSAATPFFAYDRRLLTERVELLRATLPAGRASSAMRSRRTRCRRSCSTCAASSTRFDVASAREMRIALDTPMPATRVSFAGPGKTEAELTPGGRRRRDDRAGVGDRGRARVARSASALGIRPRVAVRVNPDFQVKGSGCGWAAARSSSASTPSRCRRCCAELAADRRRLPRLPHLRRLAEPQRRDPLRGAAQDGRARPAARRTTPGAGPLPQPRRRLRHPVLRARTSRSTSPRSARTSPTCSTTAIRPRAARGAGRASSSAATSSASAGVYVTRVVDRKESRGKTFLVVDGGMHHQLAASGNFGQVIRRNYPVAVGEPAGRGGRPRRSPSSAACARRSTCSATTSHLPRRRDRRPRRGVPGRRLRPDRQPDRVPGPPGSPSRCSCSVSPIERAGG